jgi:dipeptide/tripeptide permease
LKIRRIFISIQAREGGHMLKKHPKDLVFIFFTEMWEGVGFSTLMAILVLIFKKRLKRFSA